MQQITVIPTVGRRVRDPGRGFSVIPDEGASVPRTSYWLRRIRDGDVVLAQEPPKNGLFAP